MTNTNFMSQMELARLLDVRPATIRAWVRQGCPEAERADRAGQPNLYRLADVVAWREDQARLSAVGDLNAMDMKEARRRKVAAEAAMAELNLQLQRGEFVSADLVAEEINMVFGAVRARLSGIGDQVALRFDAAESVPAFQSLIDGAICEALDEISGGGFVADG